MQFIRFRSAFTLIELLVVIAIIAVLAVAAILTLNPVQLIRQSRDATRVADLATTKKALALYQFTNGSLGAANTVYVSIPDSSSSCANLGLPALPAGWTYACAPSSSYRKPDGTGWIPIDLTILSTGSPIGALPIDPINTTSTNFYYTYIASSSIYKFTASLESQKQMNMMAKDGGIDPALFETGTPSIPSPRGGLVGYWRFDEGGGTTAGDSSGGGNTGTLTNGPTWAAGQVGGGLTTNNLNSYVGVADTAVLKYAGGGMTISIWENESEADTGWLISKPWNASGQYNYYIKSMGNGTMHASLYGNIVWYSALVTVSKNVWHMVTFTVAADKSVKIYVDGTLADSETHTISSWVPPGGDTSKSLAIGTLYPYGTGWAGDATFTFGGSIDDVRIYNRALSAAEIQALYNATK